MKYKLFEGDTENVAYVSTHDESREVMKKLLARRGLESKEEIEAFLSPSYELLVRDPFEIKDMEKAAKRVLGALRNGEKFCLYSDYDCDGIPGGTVLSDFFDHIGYTNRVHYIPHRHKEGYGLNKGAIDKLTAEGVTLMITVDSGITNVEEVAYAEEKGIDVILTDHHLPLREEVTENEVRGGKLGKQILPKAFAVLNSKRDDCEYHDDMLCGCALAWKLSCAVLFLLRKDADLADKGQTAQTGVKAKAAKKKKEETPFSDDYKKILEKVKNTKEGWEKWWLDLVAISTIADMVPLVKENRALAYFGMKVLQKSSRAGLQKLLALSKSKQAKLTAMDIAFTIAPRVNAASRMSEPIVAYHMLRGNASFAPLAISSAEELESLNQIRKDTVKGIKKEVMGYDLDIHTHVVVIGNESWGPGVLGLIAQEVFDETGKPTFVWGMGEQEHEYKGSCRAPEHVDLVALMSASLAGTLLGFGGHARAGGFSVEREKASALAEALNAAYQKLELSHEVPEEEVIIDALLPFDNVSSKFHKELEKLEPCGEGNPKPTFAFLSDGALSVREFGKQGGHYEILYAKENGESVKTIYFFGEAEKLALLTGKHTLIAQLEESHFGWKPELRLRVVDVVKEL
jgi:single-stranded-DNA-specific exonuclease